MPTLPSVIEAVSGTSLMPMMLPDNQSMAPMTTDFTDNTEESGNSSANAVLRNTGFLG
jgi:hypothetical protein